MQKVELSQLAVTRAETDGDLEAMVEVRRRATPDVPVHLEHLRFHLNSKPELVYVVARLAGEPAACGYVEEWPAYAVGDVVVVPDRRRRGIGAAVLADLSARARGFGKDSIQGEVRENDAASRAFLERRGFVQVGAEKAVVLALAGVDPPDVDPPPGVRIVSRVEQPDLLEQMYVVGVQADEDIPGQDEIQTFEQWRANEIDHPSRRPEFCFIALEGDEVVGYAALQVYEKKVYHGLTATRRDRRRRGVATALKRAEIAAAKRAGFERLITESEERNEPMRRLNEKLGFVPSPDLSMVVMRGPA